MSALEVWSEDSTCALRTALLTIARKHSLSCECHLIMARNKKKARKWTIDPKWAHHVTKDARRAHQTRPGTSGHSPDQPMAVKANNSSPIAAKVGLKNRNNRRSKSGKDSNKKIWFDGVDKCLIRSSMIDTNSSNQKNKSLVKETSFSGLTQIVAMDCEMVGTGIDGTTSVLARVSIVNFFGHCIYDKYVKPIEEVTDYRTAVSGIRPSDLIHAIDFKTVQKEVHQILKDRTVVGHALSNDFKALFLSHPKHKTRDTSVFFRKLLGGPRPSLKKLAETLLGVKVQSGEHDSVEDARAAMRLFTMYRKKWETSLKGKASRFHLSKKKKKKKKN